MTQVEKDFALQGVRDPNPHPNPHRRQLAAQMCWVEGSDPVMRCVVFFFDLEERTSSMEAQRLRPCMLNLFPGWGVRDWAWKETGSWSLPIIIQENKSQVQKCVFVKKSKLSKKPRQQRSEGGRVKIQGLWKFNSRWLTISKEWTVAWSSWFRCSWVREVQVSEGAICSLSFSLPTCTCWVFWTLEVSRWDCLPQDHSLPLGRLPVFTLGSLEVTLSFETSVPARWRPPTPRDPTTCPPICRSTRKFCQDSLELPS